MFLLDLGVFIDVNRINLKTLDEKWCRQLPLAIRCSLFRKTSVEGFESSEQQHQTNPVGVLIYQADGIRFNCINNLIFENNSTSTDESEGEGTTNATGIKKLNYSERRIGSKMRDFIFSGPESEPIASQQATSSEHVLGAQSADDSILRCKTIFKSVLETGTRVDCAAQSTFSSIITDRGLLNGILAMNYANPSRIQVLLLFIPIETLSFLSSNTEEY